MPQEHSATNHTKITCPQCRTQISIDEAFTQQIETQLRAQFTREKNELQKRAQSQLAAQEQKLKSELKSQLQAQLAQENKKEFELLAEQLQEKAKKLEVAQQKELELRKQANQLAEKQKELELEVQRKIDAERRQIEEQATKKAVEQEHAKISELQKQLQDAQKSNTELTRKLNQGSQQNQGEVLELELENTLIHAFPTDEIQPVAKGASGADITQQVRNHLGQICGTIIWESKQTKNFSEGWIAKLKEDQRRAKAEFAILVTTVLPKDIPNFGAREGIWITDFASAIGLATALRLNLLQLYTAKQTAVGKDLKMEALYQYITGTEFKHRIESITEAFNLMQQDLEKEKQVFQKQWAKREKQISQVISNTFGLYGSLEGLVGESLPSIDLLESPDEDSTEESLETASLFAE